MYWGNLFFQGELVQLACSKHGSRSVDALWHKSSPKTKETIAAELAGKESVLNADHFGKFVSTTCVLSLFRRSREEWRQMLARETKKKDIFADFLGDKKRKKAKDEDAEKEEEPLPVVKKVKEEDISPPKKKKKKKAVTSSYLDDL